MSDLEPEQTLSSHDKLVYMANQIGKAFSAEPHDAAVAAAANHIRLYWDPRMRRIILEHLDKGGAGLEPIALEAVRALKGKK
ncbi:MAG: formate dehydrogenase subunit delta [Hyphomonadaceae bacterium]|nr:formate dehydrogenase subunit delta [Hyphomonadaceae bacterium]